MYGREGNNVCKHSHLSPLCPRSITHPHMHARAHTHAHTHTHNTYTHHTHAHTHTQLKEDLNTSLSDSAQQAEQLSALREALNRAEGKEREGREALEVLKEEHQLQMRELQQKVNTSSSSDYSLACFMLASLPTVQVLITCGTKTGQW